MRIDCPHCGPRDSSEFFPREDASRVVPDDSASTETWARFVYQRPNPKGQHREFWHHRYGCGQWLVVTRDTTTHRIESVQSAHDMEPLISQAQTKTKTKTTAKTMAKAHPQS